MLNRISPCHYQILKSSAFWHYTLRNFGSLTTTSSSPRSKSGWSGLGAFATSEEATKAWRSLKQEEDEVDATIERYLSPEQRESTKIDWDYWDRSIKHKSIVDCLKSAYLQQVEVMDKALLIEMEKDVKVGDTAEDNNGWELFDEAVESCEKAVAASEELVADGARGLWVSHRNPPAWTIAPDEWLDSDLWWQAYIERHHHFDPAKDVETLEPDLFESDAADEAIRREWERKVDLFHDRSDTPTLYEYMDQPHSYDYYDVHRRVFLEHMVYHLIRTGNSHHFFPQIPPTEWIVNIDKLKFRWLSAAHARRKARQLMSLSREEALDLSPQDSEIDHHGEEYLHKLLIKERETWESLVARLMADFCFLCYPAIPCTSTVAFHRSIAVDSGRGIMYSLGRNIAALFYVPDGCGRPFSDEIQAPPPRPLEALLQWKNHLGTTGRSINPGYEDFLQIHAEILEDRGEHWFSAPGESIREAFIRRIASDDPSKKVYEHYLQELEAHWKNSTEIPLDEAFAMMPTIESEAKETDFAFKIYLQATSQSGVQNLNDKLVGLQASGMLDESLHQRGIVLINICSQQKVKDNNALMNEMKNYNEQKRIILEAINATKLPVI